MCNENTPKSKLLVLLHNPIWVPLVWVYLRKIVSLVRCEYPQVKWQSRFVGLSLVRHYSLIGQSLFIYQRLSVNVSILLTRNYWGLVTYLSDTYYLQRKYVGLVIRYVTIIRVCDKLTDLFLRQLKITLWKTRLYWRMHCCSCAAAPFGAAYRRFQSFVGHWLLSSVSPVPTTLSKKMTPTMMTK